MSGANRGRGQCRLAALRFPNAVKLTSEIVDGAGTDGLEAEYVEVEIQVGNDVDVGGGSNGFAVEARRSAVGDEVSRQPKGFQVAAQIG